MVISRAAPPAGAKTWTVSPLARLAVVPATILVIFTVLASVYAAVVPPRPLSVSVLPVSPATRPPATERAALLTGFFVVVPPFQPVWVPVVGWALPVCVLGVPVVAPAGLLNAGSIRMAVTVVVPALSWTETRALAVRSAVVPATIFSTWVLAV